MLACLLLWTVGAASAQAASAAGRHAPAGSRPATAGLTTTRPSARAQIGALAQMTGLRPSQVSQAAVCAPAALGHVRCAAQALVLRASRQLVRPHVTARRSFTQVFPRVARGVTPSSTTGGPIPPQAGSPAYLQQSYDLSYLSQTGGSTQTVAIVDAYDDPNAEADLATYRATYGLPACTAAAGCFRKVNEHGATSPLPTANVGWEMEISLDLDSVSALCPNCHIDLVEASSTSLSDMNQAESAAAALGATQISDSWSGASSSAPSGTYTFPGVAVVAATGDNGYVGPGYDAYPAAFPGVTAVGGTTLTPASSAAPNARGYSESAWSLSGGNGGGSGCDVREAKPAYQTDTGCTGRAYSDVSADGNPSTGLIVYDAGNGGWLLVGGTSLATPLVAAFDAITGVAGSTPQWAYADSGLLNDPATGTNGSCATAIAYICNARPGYDGPTGAGSISGDVVTGGPGIGGPSIGSGSGNTYTAGVSATGATLSGGIYPNGLATTYWWQYGTSTAYGQQTPATSIGSTSTPVPVSDTLAGLDPGTTYHYRLVAENADGTSYGYDYSLATNASAPVALAAPTVAGTPRQGQGLSATAGTWNPNGFDTYQWKRSTNGGRTWSAISGATSTGYTLTAADVGARIEMTVTATNGFGATSATSAAAGPVQPAAPVATALPVISGSPWSRQLLRTSAGAWNPAGTNSYQWRRSANGGRTWSAIAGATTSSYRLSAVDIGDRIDVTVTAANAAGRLTATSAAIGPVTATAAETAKARAKAKAATVARAKAATARTKAARSRALASAVLSKGDRVLRSSRGVRVAIAHARTVSAGTGRSPTVNTSGRSVRLITVSRIHGIGGKLRTWVCTQAGGAGRCTRTSALTSATTVRLPAWMHGDVLVLVGR